MSEVLWVPVPGGLAGSRAVVQVLVVPRLQGGPLSDFGMEDWPALLEAASFELRTRTSEGIHTVAADVTYVHTASSELWREFFGGAAGVANEFAQKTYPAPAVADTYGQASAVVGTYQESATAMAVPDVDADAVVRDKLGTWFDPTPLPPPAPAPPVPPPPTADFHGTVALLREHPTVLRRLGLVFEVTVDRSALEVGAADDRFLSVRCPDPPLSFLITAPWTHYRLAGTQFVPAPSANAAADIRDGLLDLGQATTISAPDGDRPTPRWAVTTFEVDGVVGRLRDAAKAERAGGERPVLPGIRTGGLSLVRPDRSADLTARVGRAAANSLLAAAEDAEFHAEDLILGYRVDIQSGDDSTWRSLCARQARYDVNGQPVARPVDTLTGQADGFADEEGHIKANAAVRDPDGTLRADQIVARWDGWSLAVPRPNLLDNTAGAVRKPDVPLPYEFGVEYRLAPGSLPPLRFSRRYSMRVRIADLAGGGHPVEHQSPNTAATGTILYLRHEPVAPPVPAADGQFAVGGSIDRLIIRSDHDRTVAELSAERPAYPLADRRTLLPPQTTFAIAEQHGEFDAGRDEERTREWAERALTVFAQQGAAAARGLPDPAANGVNAVLRAEAGGLTEPLSERSAWRPNWPDQGPKTVELVEGTGEPGIAMHWDGDRLVVALARGEQATLALSSTIRDGYTDHFAMYELLSNADIPDASLVGAQNGAHPLLSPPQVLRLVHAVRRPLVEPRWRLPEDRVVRVEGDTTVLLHPRFDEDGLNTDSTAAIDVAATWTERDDSGTRDVTVEHLHTESIGRGEPAFAPLRHAFGDTRHRVVTYTLTAVSRFRDCFAPDEPDAAFRIGRTQSPVSVPSSARPPAPQVLAVRPALRRLAESSTSDRIEHARTGCLRVELGRPWFQTGDGECLAVLVPLPDRDGTELTRLGRDPIVGSAQLPPFPADTWFGRGRKVFAPDLATEVLAVPFPVVDAGDRWLADVAVTPPVASYLPFVRLVVARYQPNSLRGLELSTVVTSEMVPLPSERHLTVTRAGRVARVELSGPMPEPANSLEVTVEEFVSPNGASPQDADLIDLTGALGEIPAWRPVHGLVTVTGATTAEVDLSALAAGSPLRLRVREVDLRPAVEDAVTPELAQRSPFLDLVDLPAAWIS